MINQRGLIGRRIVFTLGLMLSALPAGAAETASHGGEANLVLPRLDDAGLASFGGFSGHALLLGGLFICGLGFVFGLAVFAQMRRRPVHRAMLEISELIYET